MDLCTFWVIKIVLRNWKDLLSILNFVVSIGVALIIWCYAYETKRLRVLTGQQVETLKEQLKIAKQQALQGLSPYLNAQVIQVFPEGVNDNFEDNYARVLERFEGLGYRSHHCKTILYRLGEQRDIPRFICLVRNHSAKVAIHVHLWIYNFETQKVYHSNSDLDVIGEREWECFVPVEPSLLYEKAKETFISYYGPDAWRVEFITKNAWKYMILLMYRDTEGYRHCVIRYFNPKVDPILHDRSIKLYSSL